MSKLFVLVILSVIALSLVECASSHSKRDINTKTMATLAGGGLG
nr:venom peptide [Acharia stimulea]